MKWLNQDINSLSDIDLLQALKSVNSIHDLNKTRKQDPRYKKRFEHQPEPEINPSFVQLKQELNDEITKRKLVP